METFRQNFSAVLTQLIINMPEKGDVSQRMNFFKNKDYISGKMIIRQKIYTSIITSKDIIQWITDAGIKLPSNPVNREILIKEFYRYIHYNGSCRGSCDGTLNIYQFNKDKIPILIFLE